eukprot:gene21283-13421_t
MFAVRDSTGEVRAFRVADGAETEGGDDDESDDDGSNAEAAKMSSKGEHEPKTKSDANMDKFMKRASNPVKLGVGGILKTCKDCQGQFEFSQEEQDFFKKKGFDMATMEAREGGNSGGGQGGFGGRGAGSSNACFKCGKEGHMSYDCPEAGGSGAWFRSLLLVQTAAAMRPIVDSLIDIMMQTLVLLIICSTSTFAQTVSSGKGGKTGSTLSKNTTQDGSGCNDACGHFSALDGASWIKTGTKLTSLTLQYDGSNYNDLTDAGISRLPMMPWGGETKQPLEKLAITSPGPKGAKTVRMTLGGTRADGLSMQLYRHPKSNASTPLHDPPPPIPATVGVDVSIGEQVLIIAASGTKFPGDLIV